ncbi:MAG: hypothetical protein IIX30_01595 [Clostridia bacterium]|nr:hypothetical protein [Clostridia bacterium]
MKLRLLDYLSDIKEFNGVSLSAKLQCTCGSNSFEFSHTGKQTRGILAPFIVKKNDQLVLKAFCPSCGNSIIVYDSTKDGAHACDISSPCEFVPLVAKSLPNQLSVVIKYNYFPEKFKMEKVYSNQFENCFIYIIDKNRKEGKALIEE